MPGPLDPLAGSVLGSSGFGFFTGGGASMAERKLVALNGTDGVLEEINVASDTVTFAGLTLQQKLLIWLLQKIVETP